MRNCVSRVLRLRLRVSRFTTLYNFSTVSFSTWRPSLPRTTSNRFTTMCVFSSSSSSPQPALIFCALKGINQLRIPTGYWAWIPTLENEPYLNRTDIYQYYINRVLSWAYDRGMYASTLPASHRLLHITALISPVSHSSQFSTCMEFLDRKTENSPLVTSPLLLPSSVVMQTLSVNVEVTK